MSRLAFLPLFFSDFLASTAEWTGEERALYLLLLGFQWTLGSLPPDPRRLCRLVDFESDLFAECWRVVSTKFVEIDGRLYNLRLEEHRAKAKAISAKNAENGSKGGRKRWHGDSERHDERHSEPDGGRHEKGNGTSQWHPEPEPEPEPSQSKEVVDTLGVGGGGTGEEPIVTSSRDITQALAETTRSDNGRRLRPLSGAPLKAKIEKLRLAEIDEPRALTILRGHYEFDPAEVHRHFQSSLA